MEADDTIDNGKIPEKGQTSDTFEEDEFERLLNEFISSEIEDDHKQEYAGDESEESHKKEEEVSIHITGIQLAITDEKECGGSYTERNQFRMPHNNFYIYAEISVHNPNYQVFSWEKDLCITLSDDRYETLSETTDTLKVSSEDTIGKLEIVFSTKLSQVKLHPHDTRTLYINVFYKENQIYRKDFTLIDIPENYMQCFRYNSFNLYRIEAGKEVDYEALGHSQNCFNHRNLGDILLLQGMENLLVKYDRNAFEDYTPEFELRLYDETGRIKANQIQLAGSYDNQGLSYISLMWEIGGSKKNFWRKGTYLIEVLFMDETVISAPFEVGNQDTESIYGRESIQPRTNIAGKKILKSENIEKPLQELNEMIGLASVKQKINNYCNLMRLEQERNRKGLPTQQHSLHAAFIGNPGTGKTTVARLLGKILKDMGLLSKGHVVYEERSTLLGQFYGSEDEKTLAAMKRAQGGILFIDEAYSLYKPEDPKDPGINVLETLLTALADESNRDWMLLLAGYPAPMKGLLSCNPGLDSRIPETNRYYFDDYSVDELMQIADLYCKRKCYQLTTEARKALQMVIRRAYSLKDETFGNGRYINSLLSEEILQNMARRVSKLPSPTIEQLITIEKEDIPGIRQGDYKKSLEKLNRMVGLKQLKKSISEHLNFVNLVRLRAEQGISTALPPMHMIFTGNPGTGKTTVADFIGEIYASLGLLSKGNVIRTERSDFIDIKVGGTEQKTKAILKSAQGNVLFIDEAYTLMKENSDSNDFGPRVIETLLTTLSREEIDLLVIMAGYPEEMEQLLESNPGLKSRFPYVFHFEDYTAEELLEIAHGIAAKQGYHFSKAAEKALKALISKEVQHKDKHFGNGRFVTRLISTKIIPAMSHRLATLPPEKQRNKRILQTIQVQDIPITRDELQDIHENWGFDERSISRSLKKLDSMIGLGQVKKAIHNFVEVSRYLNKQGLLHTHYETPLKWSFTGNTGTGKSTVAGIMAELLHAMNLLDKGHLVELKAEEIYNVQDYKVDEILRNAMKRSQQGVLFIDGDAPVFKSPRSHFDSEKLRFQLTTLTADLPGNYALIIAEHESVRQPLVSTLTQHGQLAEFDHTLHFEDYTADELMQILIQMLKQHKWRFSEDAQSIMARYIEHLCANRNLGYANARTMKLLARSITNIALLRESKATGQTLKGIIQPQDVADFVWKDIRHTVGFK